MPDAAFINVRPRFLIDGELHERMTEGALEVRAHAPRSGRAHAELRLLNWGRADTSTGFVLADIQLGSSLEVRFSEEFETSQFSGEITAIEERYGDGAPKLVVLAEDRLHRLARQRHSRAFESQSVDEIIQTIALEASLSADVSVSSCVATFYQHNESSLAFLQRFLQPFGVPFRVKDGVLHARTDTDDPDPVLVDPRDNARRVRLVADLNHQVRRTRVKGWDVGSGECIDADEDSSGSSDAGQTAADELERLSWAAEETLMQPTPISQALADAYAAGRLHDAGGQFVHGSVACTGLPEMTVGRQIELTGVSERLRGLYRVAHCRHTYDTSAGYQTLLQVQRPHRGRA